MLDLRVDQVSCSHAWAVRIRFMIFPKWAYADGRMNFDSECSFLKDGCVLCIQCGNPLPMAKQRTNSCRARIERCYYTKTTQTDGIKLVVRKRPRRRPHQKPCVSSPTTFALDDVASMRWSHACLRGDMRCDSGSLDALSLSPSSVCLLR